MSIFNFRKIVGLNWLIIYLSLRSYTLEVRQLKSGQCALWVFSPGSLLFHGLVIFKEFNCRRSCSHQIRFLDTLWFYVCFLKPDSKSLDWVLSKSFPHDSYAYNIWAYSKQCSKIELSILMSIASRSSFKNGLEHTIACYGRGLRCCYSIWLLIKLLQFCLKFISVWLVVWRPEVSI